MLTGNIRAKAPPIQWDSLPKGINESLSIRFGELADQGLKLYMMTLMFGYVPGLRVKGVWNLERVEARVERMWRGLMGRLYDRPERSSCFGAVFWDVGEYSGLSGGFHAHLIMAVDERRFRSKYRGGFTGFWERESGRFVNRVESGRDILVRAHIQEFDGAERGIAYCSKSIGAAGGLGVGDVLLLGCT